MAGCVLTLRVWSILWTWLLALVGGFAGQWLYTSKRATEKPTPTSP